MAFTNDSNFEDDFRKVGPDATAGFAPAGAPANPTEHASSENVEVAGAADEDDDLEEDEDLDDDEDTDDEDDDLEDDDLEEDDDEEDEDDNLDDEDVDDEDDEEEDDEDEDDLEEDDDTVKARLGAAEKRVRAS